MNCYLLTEQRAVLSNCYHPFLFSLNSLALSLIQKHVGDTIQNHWISRSPSNTFFYKSFKGKVVNRPKIWRFEGKRVNKNLEIFGMNYKTIYWIQRSSDVRNNIMLISEVIHCLWANPRIKSYYASFNNCWLLP